MAVDRTGVTIAEGQVLMLCGTVVRIVGDQVLLKVGNRGDHPLRVKAGEVLQVDDLVKKNGTPAFTASPTCTVAASGVFDLVRLNEINGLASFLLGLIGASQPLDATLTALAGLATAANKLGYWTGADTAALTDLTAYMRTVLAATTSEEARTLLEIEGGGGGGISASLAMAIGSGA